MPIQLLDGGLCMLLVVEVDEREGALRKPLALIMTYLDPALAGTNLGEDLLELGRVDPVRHVSNEQTHGKLFT